MADLEKLPDGRRKRRLCAGDRYGYYRMNEVTPEQCEKLRQIWTEAERAELEKLFAQTDDQTDQAEIWFCAADAGSGEEHPHNE